MADGATVVAQLHDALTEDETWVIGGAQIYSLALPIATRCEVTEVEIDLRREDGDVVAPVLDESWIGTDGGLADQHAPACATDSTATFGHEQAHRSQARRIAVAAQGFHEPKPRGAVTRAHLRRLISRIQVLQLDSVSVAVRAHYAPVFSRLGPYDRDVVDRAAWSHSARSPRLLVEYWAHEAALMSVDDWPLLRWRMREYTDGRWGKEIVKKNRRLADDIVAAVAELGPSTAGQIEAHLGAEQRGKKGPWWDRSDTKWVTEALFAAGVLTTATRVGFARHYDVSENVLPPEVLAREVGDDEAVRELTLRAATALGVGTEADIRDYFRFGAAQAKPAIAKLVADGELEPVEVEGWKAPAYLRAGQTVPRYETGDCAAVPVRSADLLPAPCRAAVRLPLPHRDLHTSAETRIRLLRMAVPARRSARGPRRSEGRTGLGCAECRRAPSRNTVRTRARVATALAGELQSMASWLGLNDVTVGQRGDLVGALRHALA